MNNRIRVLLADDGEVTRRGWRSALNTDPQIEVIGEATTSVEALSLVRDREPDIVLMDLKWGNDKTAGWTAIREMKRLSLHTKVIAITAYDDLILDARRAGADAALSKDFALGQLLSLINELCSAKFDLSPNQQMTVPSSELTSRELEALKLIADGCSDKEISEKLVISESTAKNHVRGLLEKLNAKNRTHAVKIARERGLIG